MKLSLYLFATEEFIKDFKVLCELTPTQLKVFNDTFKLEDDIDFDEEKIKSVIEKLNVDVKKITNSVSVAKFIFKKVIEVDLTKEELKLELKTLAEKNGIKLIGKKLSTLVEFFDIPQQIRAKYSKIPYKKSIIPLLSTCTALFDIRAMYDDENKDNSKISSLFPIAIIRSIAKDDKDNIKSIEFQAGIEGLDNLLGWLKAYRERLLDLEKKIKQINL